MTDHDLREALRSLPRHRASKEFTDRVLDRWDADRNGFRSGIGPDRPTSLLAAVAAAALVLLALGLAAFLTLSPPSGSPEAGRTAETFASRPEPSSQPSPAERDPGGERARMRAELEELKRLAASLNETWAGGSEPVLYVGGDDRVELVLDIERLAARQAGGAFPATYRPSEPHSGRIDDR